MLIGSLISPERTVHISSTLIPNKLIMVMAIMMNPRLMQNDGSLMQQGYLLRGLHGPATGMDSCGFHGTPPGTQCPGEKWGVSTSRVALHRPVVW